MTILLTVFHVLVCVFLILVVLTQQGKGQDLASAFGGAGTQAAFGARGTATLLTRVTAVCAAIFMVTSLLLGYIGSEAGQRTVVDEATGGVPLPAATTPAPDETETEGETPPAEPDPESGEAAPDEEPDSPSPDPR